MLTRRLTHGDSHLRAYQPRRRACADELQHLLGAPRKSTVTGAVTAAGVSRTGTADRLLSNSSRIRGTRAAKPFPLR